jgi:hypothetical protein
MPLGGLCDLSRGFGQFFFGFVSIIPAVHAIQQCLHLHMTGYPVRAI